MSHGRWWPLLTCLLASAGPCACAYRPGHPVIRGPWGSGGPRPAPQLWAASSASDDPVEHEVDTPARIDAFFGDMGQMRFRLREMRARAAPIDQPIAGFSDRQAAAGLMRRLEGRGPLGGTLRNAVVYGISGRLPITTQQAGWLWYREELQGKALGIQAFKREERVFELSHSARMGYRVELLGVGTKPLTFDLVFGLSIEGLELPDGTVLLRYDPRPVPGARHVTLWRGGCIFEPEGQGCVVTEVVAFGTDIHLPLLEPVLRGQIEEALTARGLNLAGFAYQLAGRPVPSLR